tara:strand:- start:821 stop:1732 length:912 start_codon:yes stop_codon:yes gene_type:complete
MYNFYEDTHAELLVSTEATKTITALLASLVLKHEKATLGWCTVHADGITFSVAAANTLRGTVTLPRALFSRWNLKNEGASQEGLGFGVNLGILLECMRIFTGNEQQTLNMSYNGDEACLLLTMVEGNAVTDCRVSTLDVEEIEAVTNPHGSRARIVLDSKRLGDALQDFHSVSDDKENPRLRLRINLQPPQVSLAVASSELGCEVVYPPPALISFQASGELEYEYSFTLLRAALRSLKESDQTCLQVGDEGLLHLLVRISQEETAADTFVEFLVAPLAAEDYGLDEEEDEEPSAQVEAEAGSG